MRAHLPLVAVVALALSSLAVVPAASAQMVRIPGTSVALTPPPGFTVARGGGLENAATGSSVSIAELPPDGYAKLAQTFTSPKTASAGFASQGIRITRIDQLAVDSGQVPLAVGDQALSGRQFKKYITVMGGPKFQTNAVLITFNLTDASPLRQADVEQVLRSVRLARVETSEEKFARLPFTFKAVAPFHAADVIGGGATALLSTFEGSDPSGRKPMLMINRGSTEAGPEETARTAEQILRGMSGFADAELTEQKPVPFGGGDGYFISAEAQGRTMLQFLRVLSNGTYVRLVARGETSALEEARSAVTEIADSVAITN
jgi:hypothetical protein